MFSVFEIRLLAAASNDFPLLKAAAEAEKRCKSCSHNKVNIHSMLRLAINKYKSDKRFVDLCNSLFKLPCTVAGVHIEPL